ncbi:hypothetical protein [Deinococcus phoenicis]|uniref:hypothetical protein n=1 Tax=Deinococcus phoenicis TaxID=1476583 RepID=UPI0004ACC602|nr:hypothetical protein [Deinococcus phoenicis]
MNPTEQQELKDIESRYTKHMASHAAALKTIIGEMTALRTRVQTRLNEVPEEPEFVDDPDEFAEERINLEAVIDDLSNVIDELGEQREADRVDFSVLY